MNRSRRLLRILSTWALALTLAAITIASVKAWQAQVTSPGTASPPAAPLLTADLGVNTYHAGLVFAQHDLDVGVDLFNNAIQMVTTSVQITSVLPNGMRFVTATTSLGACNLAQTSNQVICALGPVSILTTTPTTVVTITLRPEIEGQYSITTSMTSPGLTDTNPSNNISTLLLDVYPAQNPSFSITGTLGFSGADILMLDPWSTGGSIPLVAIPASNLGLTTTDELDALSYGTDTDAAFSNTEHPLYFSVDQAATGAPHSAVEQQAICGPGEVSGDEFAVPLPGQNRLYYDEDGVPCIAGSPTRPPLGLTAGDNLDALTLDPPSAVDTDGDHVPDRPVYFSLAPGSPSLIDYGADPGDILVAVSTTQGINVHVFASSTQLGLQPGDNIDALMLIENGDGLLDLASPDYPAGDKVIFSLDAASAQRYGLQPGDLLTAVPDPASDSVTLAPAFPAELAGLNAGDNIDALKGNVDPIWWWAPFPKRPPQTAPTIGCVVSPTNSSGPPWEMLASLPVPREGGFATVIGDRIYVGQGLSAFGDDTFTFIYDIPSNTWLRGSPAPIGRSEVNSACAEENGRGLVYVVGGRSLLSSTVLSEVYAYDPISDTWSARPPMPTPRAGLGLVWVPTSNTLFAIGGRTGLIPHDGTPLNVVEAFDVNANRWITKTAMPIPLMDVYATVYYSPTHEIYVFGGYDGAQVTTTVQVYDVAGDRWRILAPMPTARSNAIAGVCNNEIFVLGGYDGTNKLIANEKFNPSLGTWSIAPPLPDPRAEFMAASISTGDALYLIGSGIHGAPDIMHDRFNCTALSQGGYIAGHKYQDHNQNGHWDLDEEGVWGWTIYLSSAASPQGTFVYTMTEADGRYQFYGLAPGVYTITEDLVPGFIQTQPGGALAGYVVTITNASDMATGLDFGNAWSPLLVNGQKYLDLNTNGVRDGNEPGLDNWPLYLTLPDGSVISTTTHDDGYFEFYSPSIPIPLGTYTLTESIPSGWLQTWPNNTIQGYTLAITSTNWSPPWLEFGNATISSTGYLEGIKFEDRNFNGLYDLDEIPIGDWPIQLLSNTGQVITTFTSLAGRYQFYGLQPGVYTITEPLDPVVTQTLPGAPLLGYTVTITGSQVITGLDFGNAWPDISGMKFYDRNHNGQPELDDPPLAEWPIMLTTPSGTVLTTTTDQQGAFSFYNLPPGVYTLTEAIPTGWQQTLPGTPLKSYVISLPLPLESNPWFPFGNVVTNTVKLSKFGDRNANRQWDPGEPPMPNVPFDVYYQTPGGTVLLTTTWTDAQGQAWLFDLMPGTYTVTEGLLSPDITQTLPGPPLLGYVFNIQAGDVITNLLFGDTILNDLGIVKSTQQSSVLAGGTIAYDLQVTNYGPGPAFKVQITDTLSQPWGTSLLPAECGVSANIVRCNLNALYPGDTRHFHLVASVPPAALSAGVLTNTVVVHSQGMDTNPLNNHAQVTTTVQPAADLAIQKIVQPEPVVGGHVLTYTIRVENRGPLDASNVQITDTLPAALTPLSIPSECVLPTSSTQVRCSLTSLPAASAAYLTITARAPLVAAPLQIMNFVEAQAASPTEANPTNNLATAYSTILPTLVTRPEVFAISPTQGPSDVNTSVVITGQNFQSGLKAFLGQTLLQVNSVSANRIDAVVPAGLSDGTYDLTVENPDGQQAMLLNAFTVFTPQRPPQLRSMHPSQGPVGRPAWSMIRGAQLTPPFVLTFTHSTQPTRTYLLGTWRFIDSQRLVVAIPASIPAGTYHLTLQNGTGLTATLTDAYTVTAQLDDLYADSVDFWVRPRTIREGTSNPVTLGLNLHRMGGTQLLNNIEVSFYLSAPGGGATTPIGSSTVAHLAPDSHAPVTFTWSSIPPAGEYVLIARIDPTHQITESNEYNNMVTRTLTILPSLADNVPPEVITFTVNHGAQTTLDRQVALSVTATDTDSGVAYVHYKEFRFDQGTHRWMLTQESGWLPFDSAHTQDAPWMLQPFAGLHYLQAWVIDRAGNVSLTPGHAFINYLPPTSGGTTPAPPLSGPSAAAASDAESAATILQDEVVIFRYRLKTGDQALAVLSSLQGDADLYVGSPDGTLLDKRETGEAVEQIAFTAAMDGIYQIEVAGYTDAVYHLEVLITAGSSNAPKPPLAPPRPRPRPRSGLLVSPGDEPSDDVNLPGNPTSTHVIHLPIIMR